MKHNSIRVRDAFVRKIEDDKAKAKSKANIGKPGPKNRPEYGAGLHNKYLTYEQAVLFNKSAEYITSAKEYKDWIKIKGYKFMPLTPSYVYRKEWQGWLMFLGADAPKEIVKRLPYYEAKSIAQALAIKYDLAQGDCVKNWVTFYDEQYLLPSDERELPKGIPRYPVSYYEEWEGWPKFLGKGLKTKLQTLQAKASIAASEKDDEIFKYNGQPVYALTTGIDAMNANVIKVIVEQSGLYKLIATCDSLQYDIISAYIFNPAQLPAILDNLNTYGTDRGNSCYVINDMAALISGLAFDTAELPRHLL